MTTGNIRRILFLAAVVVYVSLTAGWLYRAPNAPVTNVSGPLYLQAFGLTLIFAPLCIIAVALRLRPRALFVWYVVLVYVAIVGGMFIGSDEFSFSPTGTPITWEGFTFNSLAFLLLLGAINFVPTAAILGLATVLRHSVRRRAQDR